MTRSTSFLPQLLLLSVATLAAFRASAQTPATQPATAPIDQAVLDARFTELFNNAVMTGSFTMNGQGGAKEDKYTITSIRKLKDDNWLFQARVQFFDKDVSLPMIIPVKWAGDTAVISVTDIWFPGLGTYSARVLVYGDQYAGTWSAGGGKKNGGHMWGNITKAPATQPAAEKAK